MNQPPGHPPDSPPGSSSRQSGSRAAPFLAALPYLLCSVGCVPALQRVSLRDLGSLSKDEMVLVGNLHIEIEGRDETSRTLLELQGAAGSYGPDARGDALWVVPRPRPGEPVRVAWISTLDHALSYGDAGPELVAAAFTSNSCVYFGEIKLRVVDTRKSETEHGAVGYAHLNVEMEVGDDAAATIARVKARNRALGRLECASSTARPVR